MNTQTESTFVVILSEALVKSENPMQERHIGEITESVEMTAEAVFLARRLEACAERRRSIWEEAGPLFVP